jgi:hypothetical protein
MKMKTNDVITLLGVSTSVLVVAFLESFRFFTFLRKQKQSRFAHTPCAI